jgi:hypothetical protein
MYFRLQAHRSSGDTLWSRQDQDSSILLWSRLGRDQRDRCSLRSSPPLYHRYFLFPNGGPRKRPRPPRWRRHVGNKGSCIPRVRLHSHFCVRDDFIDDFVLGTPSNGSAYRRRIFKRNKGWTRIHRLAYTALGFEFMVCIELNLNCFFHSFLSGTNE